MLNVDRIMSIFLRSKILRAILALPTPPKEMFLLCAYAHLVISAFPLHLKSSNTNSLNSSLSAIFAVHAPLLVIQQTGLLQGSRFSAIFYLTLLRISKDALIERIKLAFLFCCSNLVVDGCFRISNPHKYRI